MARWITVWFLVVFVGGALCGFADDAELGAPSARQPHVVQAVMEHVSLPTGTAIRMKLDKPLSSERSLPGDRFSGRIAQPDRKNGKTVIPAGASISGQVTRVSSPRRIKGKPSIVLLPEQVTLADGEKLHLSATVVDTGQPRELDVDDEGHIRGRGRDGSDNRETLVGTGAGAGIGAIAAGGPGALVGAGVGATVTTAHWLIRHRTVEIPAGTELILELKRPLALNRGREQVSE